jgi:hypothetical protein
MKYLVFCMCGHALDRHGARGCEGDGMPCRCRKHARSHPWGAARTPDMLVESEIA